MSEILPPDSTNQGIFIDISNFNRGDDWQQILLTETPNAVEQENRMRAYRSRVSQYELIAWPLFNDSSSMNTEGDYVPSVQETGYGFYRDPQTGNVYFTNRVFRELDGSDEYWAVFNMEMQTIITSDQHGDVYYQPFAAVSEDVLVGLFGNANISLRQFVLEDQDGVRHVRAFVFVANQDGGMEAIPVDLSSIYESQQVNFDLNVLPLSTDAGTAQFLLGDNSNPAARMAISLQAIEAYLYPLTWQARLGLTDEELRPDLSLGGASPTQPRPGITPTFEKLADTSAFLNIQGGQAEVALSQNGDVLFVLTDGNNEDAIAGAIGLEDCDLYSSCATLQLYGRNLAAGGRFNTAQEGLNPIWDGTSGLNVAGLQIQVRGEQVMFDLQMGN